MIAIIDYKAGNLTSVQLGLEFLGIGCEVTNDPSRILAAERVIFPGVGAAGAAMRNLRELGLVKTIRTVVSRGTPFLGICLGTQIIFEFSEEDSGTPCIGLVPGKVIRFDAADASGRKASRSMGGIGSVPICKIPQMGWNTVEIAFPHPLFEGIDDSSEFYFVHSYYPAPSDETYVMGTTSYAGATFASAVGKRNLFAVQFHPERSGRIGLRMLENFSRWTPSC